MLLRSVTKHVKDQNWFAVFLDFFIVVAGILIAIQITEWYEAQSNKVGLTGSLERLDKEVSQNLDIIEVILAHITNGKADMTLGREALNDCAYTPKAQAALERTLFDLVEDVQPNFVTVALDQLARQDQYRNLFSPQFQEGFGFYAGWLKEEHEQLTSHYDNMWFHHVNFHPDVSAYFSNEPGDVGNPEDYVGWGFKLDKPFEEMCTDASFRNRFINTIGFYTGIERRLKQFKTRAEKFQTSIAEELDRQ